MMPMPLVRFVVQSSACEKFVLTERLILGNSCRSVYVHKYLWHGNVENHGAAYSQCTTVDLSLFCLKKGKKKWIWRILELLRPETQSWSSSGKNAGYIHYLEMFWVFFVAFYILFLFYFCYWLFTNALSHWLKPTRDALKKWHRTADTSNVYSNTSINVKLLYRIHLSGRTAVTCLLTAISRLHH